MSLVSPRKDRRKKWWSEKKKSRATVREGLRPNPSTVNPFVITTENKGGFKQSDHTKKVLSSSSNISEIRTTRATTEHRNHAKSTSENRNHDKTKDKNQSKVKNGSKNDKVKIDTSKKKNETNSKSKSENSLEEKKTLETKYVLFIGNLPYSVTKENLEEHFRKTGGVKKIRIPQDKAKQCSRGFAYIEFKDRISHGIALRLHHTTLGGRKINVEFTSIGGKNEKRKEKLKQKNEALAKFKMPLDS